MFKDVVVRFRRDTAVWQAVAYKGDKPSTARVSVNVVGFSILSDAVVVREDLALIPRDEFRFLNATNVNLVLRQEVF